LRDSGYDITICSFGAYYSTWINYLFYVAVYEKTQSNAGITGGTINSSRFCIQH